MAAIGSKLATASITPPKIALWIGSFRVFIPGIVRLA
jgi:hypothetical protein